jgi:hypothetical protein
MSLPRRERGTYVESSAACENVTWTQQRTNNARVRKLSIPPKSHSGPPVLNCWRLSAGRSAAPAILTMTDRCTHDAILDDHPRTCQNCPRLPRVRCNPNMHKAPGRNRNPNPNCQHLSPESAPAAGWMSRLPSCERISEVRLGATAAWADQYR